MPDETDLFRHAPTQGSLFGAGEDRLQAPVQRYLPDPEGHLPGQWTHQRHAQARALVRRLLQAHDEDLPAHRPHAELIALASRPLNDAELAASLNRGWTLAIHSDVSCDDSPTPVTRIALPVRTDTRVEPFSSTSTR